MKWTMKCVECRHVFHWDKKSITECNIILRMNKDGTYSDIASRDGMPCCCGVGGCKCTKYIISQRNINKIMATIV